MKYTWDWGKSVKHLSIFAVYLVTLVFVWRHIIEINSMFLKVLPVGYILLLVIVALLVDNLYSTVKYDKHWIIKTHCYKEIILQLCLYLIVLSIILSQGVVVNTLAINNTGVPSDSLADNSTKLTLKEYTTNAACLNAVFTVVPNVKISKSVHVMSEESLNNKLSCVNSYYLASIEFTNTGDYPYTSFIQYAYIVYNDGTQQDLKFEPILHIHHLAPGAKCTVYPKSNSIDITKDPILYLGVTGGQFTVKLI
jgi:hypothetical protein